MSRKMQALPGVGHLVRRFAGYTCYCPASGSDQENVIESVISPLVRWCGRCYLPLDGQLQHEQPDDDEQHQAEQDEDEAGEDATD